MNLLFLVLTYHLLVPEFCNLLTEWRGLPAALMLSFYPIALALMQGQDSILLVMLLAAALHFLRRGRDSIAGLVTGMGLFKFQIVLPIALLFLLWRRWRFLGGFSAATFIAGLVSVLVTGGSQTMKFVQSIMSVGGGIAAGAGSIQFPLRISIMANLRGLVENLCASALSPETVKILIFVLSAAVILWVGVDTLEKTIGDSLVVAIVASVLVSYYLFIHDLSVLFIPVLVALNRSASRVCLLSISAAMVWISPTLVFLIPGRFYLVAMVVMTFLWSMVRQYANQSPHEANWNAAVIGEHSER
jgi:hypothetical protein